MVKIYALVAAINLIAFLLVLIPLPWLFRRWNVGVWMFAIWVSIACLMRGVNVIVWRDNDRIVSPIWCDICVRFLIGFQVALPASSLSITRRIYQIVRLGAEVRRVDTKRKDMLIDMFLCLGLPLIAIGLSHIVQEHRFVIIEELGCLPTIANNVPAYFLVYAWPLTIGCMSSIYCISVAFAFFRYRAELKRIEAADKTLSYGSYNRVFLLGCVDAVTTVPISAFQLWVNLTKDGPVQPWKGWAFVHSNYSHIDQIPKALWSLDYWITISVRWNQWLAAYCAFMFLCFFGFTGYAPWSLYIALRNCARKISSRPSVSPGEDLTHISFSSFALQSSDHSKFTVSTSVAPSYPGSISNEHSFTSEETVVAASKYVHTITSTHE